MPSTIRAFIAARISVSTEVREVREALASMGPAVRATSRDNLHLTLKFLGDCPQRQAAAVTQQLRDACRTAAPLSGEFFGLGVFPSRHRPDVIWAGLRPADGLARLARDLDARLAPLGFPAEERAFHPHLTLARVKFRTPERLPALLDQLHDRALGNWVVDAAELIRSDQTPGGSKYTSLATFSFAKG